MDPNTLHDRYFRHGTGGFAVMQRFFRKYRDVLRRVHCVEINDVVNDVFLSLSRSDFREVTDEQRYVLRAIKLHCWSLLDKALRHKAVEADHQSTTIGPLAMSEQADPVAGLAEIEGMELLSLMNLFKLRIGPDDVRILNLLIDETPRTEIAETLLLNLNTLDTRIRRLRIKMADFLLSRGYASGRLDKFGSRPDESSTA